MVNGKSLEPPASPLTVTVAIVTLPESVVSAKAARTSAEDPSLAMVTEDVCPGGFPPN